MNFFDILSEVENLDPELSARIDSRRSVFKHMGGLGQKLTAAALPLAVGAVFNKAYAQTPVGLSVVDVLNFALRLEYLESIFYQQRSGLTSLSPTNSAALSQIATDEANHVTFLRTVITSLGGTPALTRSSSADVSFCHSSGGAAPPASATWRAWYFALPISDRMAST